MPRVSVVAVAYHYYVCISASSHQVAAVVEVVLVSSVVTRWCFYHYYVLYFSFLSPGGRGRGGGVGVQRSPSAIKEMLLNWCRAMTKEYDVCHGMPTDQILY